MKRRWGARRAQAAAQNGVQDAAVPARAGIDGDRGRTLLDRTHSLQSRLSNLLALGLMSAIGVGALLWYYGAAMARPGQARRNAQAVAARAPASMPLPALGPVVMPVADVAARASSPTAPVSPLPVPPVAIGAGDAIAAPIAAVPLPLPVAPAARTAGASAPDRRLASGVWGTGHEPETFAGATSPVSSPAPAETDAVAGSAAAAAAATAAGAARTAAGTAGGVVAAGSGGGTALDGWLQTFSVPMAQARVLPTQRLLLPRGAFIDCTLETAIDSTLPGMTTCVTATDTFGADGKVVLLERGTKLVGETRGQVQQGAARVFVLWTEARTPTGVIVPLDSPGTDELGRSGLPGQVQRHFFDRFGAAILVSVIDGAVQAAVQSGASRGSTVVVSPSAPADVMAGVLKSTLDIAPSVIKHNGDRIQVLVARDVDFTHVYQLRRTAVR